MKPKTKKPMGKKPMNPMMEEKDMGCKTSTKKKTKKKGK